MGRPRQGNELRVAMTCSISAETIRRLQIWQAKAMARDPAARIGQVLDSLTRFGISRRFRP